MRKSIVGLVAAAALAMAAPALAQGYPERPITWVVPFTPGGITDTNSRLIAEEMSKSLGQRVIIENKSGAGGLVGTEYVARAKPDGYTLIYATLGTVAASVALQKELKFDPLKDFEPIHMMANTPNILVVYKDRPYKTVQELIDYAKKNPGKVNFASAGVGTGTHLAAELFKSVTGVDIVHVPYRGSAPALQDLIAGRVDIMFDYPVSASPHVQAGNLVPLAITSEERISLFPDVPTIKELGFEGAVTGSWAGIMVPAKTPRDAVEKLTKAAHAAMRDPKIQEHFAKYGSKVMLKEGAEMRKFHEAEIERWKQVIESAGIPKL